MAEDTISQKVKPEDMMLKDGHKLSDGEIECSADVYTDFYKMRTYRSGLVKQFRNYQFDEYLRISRELFWNSLTTDSDDLRKIGLEFSIPFARKESMDFLAKLSSLNIKPKIEGDDVDALALKICQGIYKKWRFHSNEKVETFWELLYGIVNGTVCSYIGYNNSELQRRYLTSFDPKTGEYNIDKKDEKYWDDVWKEIVPIEEIYLPKIFERNIQKQGRLIRRRQLDEADFHAEYDKYPLAKYVYPGMRIAEDSLFYRLLGGTGTTSALKIEVMNRYNWITDEYEIVAGGLVLNKLGGSGKFEKSPMPFNHKMAPFTWGIMSPLDEKLAYGLSTTFQAKDPHKILNTAYTMMVERELRAIDPTVLSSDLESPDIIYGQHKVLQVNDVNAYKEFNIKEPSPQFFNMMNSLQSNMSANTNGGDAAVLPSRQPNSARKELNDEQLKQQSISNATLMYYDILRQQVLLVLKTAFQFYTTDKYKEGDKQAIRTLLVSDVPLTLGGIGNMKIRIVKDGGKSPDMSLLLEGIKNSVESGKNTEVVEVPVSFLQNLEVLISDIELESDNPTEIELANFVENVINPMLNVYVPMGLADPSKVMMRHVEKMKESISDFASDANATAMMSGKPIPPPPQQPQAGANGPTGQSGVGQTQGNLLNATKNMGNAMNQGGTLTPSFGSQKAKSLVRK